MVVCPYAVASYRVAVIIFFQVKLKSRCLPESCQFFELKHSPPLRYTTRNFGGGSLLCEIAVQWITAPSRVAVVLRT